MGAFTMMRIWDIQGEGLVFNSHLILAYHKSFVIETFFIFQTLMELVVLTHIPSLLSDYKL